MLRSDRVHVVNDPPARLSAGDAPASAPHVYVASRLSPRTSSNEDERPGDSVFTKLTRQGVYCE